MADSKLLIRPSHQRAAGGEDGIVVNTVSAERANWELLNFEVRELERGQSFSGNTEGTEAVFVVLGGRARVQHAHGEWSEVGRRSDVFSGMPWAFYLSRETSWTIHALGDGLQIARAWAASDETHPPQLITPDDSCIEIRGGHNATRQINSIVPPGFDCDRLVCVEVYTPGGNWSSYPPHKHDEHIVDASGIVREADLEEIYYYKVKGRRGYAIQRVYNGDRTLDEVAVAHSDDLVLVPEGYHPVSAAYGYDCYYLNFLAGSAQSLANSDDPDYAWVQDTWTAQDPRLPMVHHGMEA